MNEQDIALEAQQSLVEDSLPLVFQTYDEAITAGEKSPVVILLDCEDPLGGEIARGWLGDEEVDQAIAIQQAEGNGDESPTVFARAIAWELCREELCEAFPYLAAALAEPPTDEGVLVLGVTAGGASALTAPFSAR